MTDCAWERSCSCLCSGNCRARFPQTLYTIFSAEILPCRYRSKPSCIASRVMSLTAFGLS